MTTSRFLLRSLTGFLAALLVVAGMHQPAAANTTTQDTYTEVSSDGSVLSGLTAYGEALAVPSMDSGYRPATIAPGPGSVGSCPPGRCYDVAVPVPDSINIRTSDGGAGNMSRVIVPAGYHAPENRNRAYPVVYVYNGAKSPYVRWSEATGLVPIASATDAILVMPEGGMNDEAGMFSDWKDGSFQWETFHTKVLPAFIDQHFRTAQGARVLVGASMGALGALNYAARHKGFAQSVLSISGSVDNSDMILNGLPPVLSPLGELLGASKPDLNRVWGSPILDHGTWRAHNPTAQARKFKENNVARFIATGTGYLDQNSPETGALVHSPWTEQLLWNGHRKFLASLNLAGVPYEARIRQGGGHHWNYFDEPLRWGLPKSVSAAIARAPQPLKLADARSMNSTIAVPPKPAAPPAPSNSFAVAHKAKAFPKKGALSVAVRVPGPGVVQVARAQKKFPVRTNRVSVSKQGVRRVAIRLTPQGIKQLQNRYVRAQRNGKKVAKMPVRVKIRYTPAGGQPRTVTRRYVVRLR